MSVAHGQHGALTDENSRELATATTEVHSHLVLLFNPLITYYFQEAATVRRCLAAVQAQAAALAEQRAAVARRKHSASDQVAPNSSPTAASQAAAASLRALSAAALAAPQPAPAAAAAAAAATGGELQSPAADRRLPAGSVAAAGPASGRKRLRHEDIAAAADSPVASGSAPGWALQDVAAMAKARRVAAALPAVDLAFFRTREAADASSSSELSPTAQQAAASRSLQVCGSSLYRSLHKCRSWRTK